MAASGQHESGSRPPHSRYVSERLPPSPEAARLARRACVPLLPLVGDRSGDLELLVTELVTNSVRHAEVEGENSIRLEVMVEDTCARVEVSDRGAGFEPPPRPEPDPFRIGGLGLVMVDHLCDAWGVFVDRGTHVWGELSHDAGRPRYGRLAGLA